MPLFTPPTLQRPFADGSDLQQHQQARLAMLALLAAAFGLTCLLAPALAAPGLPLAVPTLHTRCLGAPYLAAAVGLAGCARQTDRALARIVLLTCLAMAAGQLLATAGLRPVPWAWWAVHAGAVAVLCPLARAHELAAPAEHADRLLLVLAALLALPAAALAVVPGQAGRWWPWPMPPAVAGLLAAPLAAWAGAAVMAARERRRAARQVPLLALALLGPGLGLASAQHLAAFSGLRATLWWCWLLALPTLALLRLHSGAAGLMRGGPARSVATRRHGDGGPHA